MEVTGKRRKKSIGLEIPASHTCYHEKPLKKKEVEFN